MHRVGHPASYWSRLSRHRAAPAVLERVSLRATTVDINAVIRVESIRLRQNLDQGLQIRSSTKSCHQYHLPFSMAAKSHSRTITSARREKRTSKVSNALPLRFIRKSNWTTREILFAPTTPSVLKSIARQTMRKFCGKNLRVKIIPFKYKVLSASPAHTCVKSTFSSPIR